MTDTSTLLISREELQTQLNLPQNQDEFLIEGKIAAAQTWVQAYIGCSDLIEKYEGVEGVPATILEAIRQLAAHLYENREGSMTIPPAVVDLLRAERAWSF